MNSYNSYEYQLGWSQGYFQAMNELQENRKKGKWVAIGNTGPAACKCGFFTDRYRAYNFCPNCGADMRQDDPSHPFADSVMMKGEDDATD